MATTRHRSLVIRGGRKAFVEDKGLAHIEQRKNKKQNKECQEKSIFTNLKKRISAHRASSRATRPFLTK